MRAQRESGRNISQLLRLPRRWCLVALGLVTAAAVVVAPAASAEPAGQLTGPQGLFTPTSAQGQGARSTGRGVRRSRTVIVDVASLRQASSPVPARSEAG